MPSTGSNCTASHIVRTMLALALVLGVTASAINRHIDGPPSAGAVLAAQTEASAVGMDTPSSSPSPAFAEGMTFDNSAAVTPMASSNTKVGDHGSPAKAIVDFSLADSPWPRFRRNVTQTGLSSYSGPQRPAQRWVFDAGSPIYSSPAIGSDGAIYFGSDKSRLYAVNPDGSQRWVFTTVGPVRSSPAVGDDGTVYAAAAPPGVGGLLYAINPDGSQKWSFPTTNGAWSSPNIGADGTVYVISDKLYAVNPDGSEKWHSSSSMGSDSSPAIGADGTIYVGWWDGASANTGLAAFSPDGTRKWVFSTHGAVDTSPAIGTDGTIYIGSVYQYYWPVQSELASPIYKFDYRIYAVNPDGTQKWYRTTDSDFRTASHEWPNASPAIAENGEIYIVSKSGGLLSYNPYGNETARYSIRSIIHSSPAVAADGTIYLGAGDHNLYAVNPDGTQKWTFATGDVIYSSPAIGADGTVYIASSDGKLYAIAETDLAIAQTVEPGYLLPGHQLITFTLTYTNFSSEAASEVTIADLIPDAVANLSYTNSGLPVTPTAGLSFNWQVGTVAPGQGGTITITGNVSPSLSGSSSFVNTSTITTTSPGFKLYAGSSSVTEFVGFPLADSPSPRHRGNNFQTGLSRYNGPAWPTSTWSFSPTSGYSEPAVAADGTIYVGSGWNNGRLYALNPDGSEKWVFKIRNTDFFDTDEFRYSPAIGADGAIYVGSLKGRMFALNPDGSQRWTFTVNGGWDSGPAIGADGTIYVGGSVYSGTSETQLFAIDPAGKLKWTVTLGTSVISAPAIAADRTIYVVSGKLWAISPDGSVRWTFDKYVPWSSPTIGPDGTVYIHDGQLYAVNPDGSQKWALPVGRGSSPAFGPDGTVFAISDKIYAISPDGSQKWAVPAPSTYLPSLTVDAHGTIYFSGEDNKLYAYNSDGTFRWVFDTGNRPDSTPVIGADGIIYVGSYGSLYAVGPLSLPFKSFMPLANR
ncbi:MAG: PQQ-binding-like beta-propeller repeat protein [Chloroflexi bacterium]|nr:PQQ-binding-like beta-propeller repeat protein [Chloroflexota bacterium]